MSSQTNDDTASDPTKQSRKTAGRRKGAGTDEVGKALRSAYDEALSEEVPDEFLSLLGKLD